MKVPEKFQKIPFRARRKRKERLERQTEREIESIQRKTPGFGNKRFIVFALIGLLFGAGGLLLAKSKSGRQAEPDHRVLTAKAGKELAILSIALDRFRADCGRYPATQEGLAALLLNPGPTNWCGRYVSHLRADPWRNAYQYRLKDDLPKLWSFGPDGTDGTADDVLPVSTNAIDINKETVNYFGHYKD